ncbi:hypothetical protein D9611_006444 [Ephemerocybe angulata]|uniref:Uncharacterized protein n=1 Tax=Ephemerocybe angulata TaxID=980116 RepID=A0A8H5C8E4_9AGAR|nr:hypothetical protein D9611_006444 [Tulosesus angulatus]
MGFLKRLFSMGGKKNTKSKHMKTSDIGQPMPKNKRGSTYATVAGAPYGSTTPGINLGNEDEDHEAAVHRLLRTSSARYAVVHEVEPSEIPPMPHPINAVVSAYGHQLQPQATGLTLHPSASLVSLASTTMSARGTGTYSVKVYRKERLSQGPEEVLADEKKKKSESAHLNANDSRTLKLRSEPSVVSLLSLYDDQGRLPEEAFSNDVSDHTTPTPKHRYHEVPMTTEEEDERNQANPEGLGRAQVKRSGSTLRQLLGVVGEKPEDASEGDISWAERFLGELDTSSNSTHSSFALPTPSSAHGPNFDAEISVVTEDMSFDNPAISSMEVEVSLETNSSQIFGDDSFATDIKKSRSYESTLHDVGRTPTNKSPNPTLKVNNGSTTPGTPQKRASQVFQFIKKRASKFVEKDERDLPEPPSAFSSPSADAHERRRSTNSSDSRRQDSNDEREVNNHLTSRFSEDSCESAFAKKKISAIPVYAGEHATPSRNKSRPFSERLDGNQGGLGHVKGMVKRFSFNLGSRESTSSREEEQREKQSEPEATPTSAPVTLPLVLETPMRPVAESDAARAERDIRILMTGPTRVIVTAPTPGTANATQQTGYTLSKIPRGPRGQNSRRRTSGSSNGNENRRREDRDERRRSRHERAEREQMKREKAEREKYKDGLTTSMISAPRKKVSTRNLTHRANASVSSTGSNENENARPAYGVMYAEAKRFVEGGDYRSKGAGNVGSLGVKPDIPLTPLRVSRRMSVNQEAFFQPPSSPAKSNAMYSPDEGREERRKPRGERNLYALPGSRSAAMNARPTRV